MTAALEGSPEVALGNAVGSVIYDDGIALPMAALFAVALISIDRVVLRSAAIFLISIDLIAWYMASDGTLSRGEGGVLVNKNGWRYLQDYDLGKPLELTDPEHPQTRTMELGPRDRPAALLNVAMVREVGEGVRLLPIFVAPCSALAGSPAALA